MNKSFEIKSVNASAETAAITSEKATLRDWIELTKPGIIRSNLVATFGGFVLATGWNIQWGLLFYAMLASALVMASSCVINNYWDRDLDRKMERTKERVLPAGKIAPTLVLWYGIILGVLGLGILYFKVNLLTTVLGVIGMFVYIVVYTMWLKRTSTWSTSIGGFSGAMPPVIGYCAVNPFDAGAWLLLIILFLWQPPHFWALGIMRKEEYRAAGYPLLPVVKGIKRTKYQMIPYVLLLLPSSILLYAFGYVGMIYLISVVILNALWLYHCIAGLKRQDDKKWASKMFMFSIQYLMLHFVVMIADTQGALSSWLFSWLNF